MNYWYRPFRKKRFLSGEGTYESYGIKVWRQTARRWFYFGEISDISPDRTLVYNLLGNCNCLSLDPIHIYDAIEDALAG